MRITNENIKIMRIINTFEKVTGEDFEKIWENEEFEDSREVMAEVAQWIRGNVASEKTREYMINEIED